MSNDLLPCPFCGGEVGFHKDEDCNGCHYIWCHSCDGMFDLSAKADPENDTETLEELNERIAPIWNNRAQQSAPADLRQIHGLILNALDRDAAEGKAARGEMAQELRALLESPAVEVEGLEVVGYADADDIKHQCHGTLSPYQWQHNNVRLTEYNKAQEIIEQQAARIAELQLDADRYRWLLEKSGFGIRRNGVTELTVAFYEIQPDNIGQLSFAIDAAMGSEE